MKIANKFWKILKSYLVVTLLVAITLIVLSVFLNIIPEANASDCDPRYYKPQTCESYDATRAPHRLPNPIYASPNPLDYVGSYGGVYNGQYGGKYSGRGYNRGYNQGYPGQYGNPGQRGYSQWSIYGNINTGRYGGTGGNLGFRYNGGH